MLTAVRHRRDVLNQRASLEIILTPSLRMADTKVGDHDSPGPRLRSRQPHHSGRSMREGNEDANLERNGVYTRSDAERCVSADAKR